MPDETLPMGRLLVGRNGDNRNRHLSPTGARDPVPRTGWSHPVQSSQAPPLQPAARVPSAWARPMFFVIALAFCTAQWLPPGHQRLTGYPALDRQNAAPLILTGSEPRGCTGSSRACMLPILQSGLSAVSASSCAYTPSASPANSTRQSGASKKRPGPSTTRSRSTSARIGNGDAWEPLPAA